MILRASLVALLLATALTSTASAAEKNLPLTGIADGDSRWYEYYSDAFGQLDQGFKGNPANDGSFLISELPDFVPIGGGADIFPREAEFDLGTLTYDDAALTGVGAETAAITGYTVDVSKNIADDDALFSTGYATTLANVAGSLSFDGGQLVGITLTSDITFTYEIGPLAYDGAFSITGNRFELLVDELISTDQGDFRYAWDSGGTIDQVLSLLAGDANGDGQVNLDDFGILKENFGTGTSRGQGDFNSDGKVDLTDFGILKDNFGSAVAVPEPASWLLASLGLVGCLLVRRKSR
jgi:hypothetical protein